MVEGLLSAETLGWPPGEGAAALLAALPVATYATDAKGRIVACNDAAVDLWGRRPKLGEADWCGSWRLYWPDGRPMPHDQCPMAVALREGRALVAEEAVLERPDGLRIPFLAYPKPIRDARGEIVGALNVLIEVTERKRDEHDARMLAAIVESSDDAIVSKTLDGVITSWNAAAEHLFGYTASEAVGQPILMLIPPDRHDEEADILARIRRGERIRHYETVRRRKDGAPIDVSITISPIRDAHGRIIGASKIARDISQRKRAQEQERLLLREMTHRIKNLFALAGSIVSISARHADTKAEMARAVRERLEVLSRAHELTLSGVRADDAAATRVTGLSILLRAMVAPYIGPDGAASVVSKGPEVLISGSPVTSCALLIHELTTNSTKHGALSSPGGRVSVEWSTDGGVLSLTWREEGGPRIDGEPHGHGFGSVLTEATLKQLSAEMTRDWRPEGLVVRLTIPLDALAH